MVSSLAAHDVSFGKFWCSKVHGKCVQMCTSPFTKLGHNPCFTKELQPNYLYVNHLRFILPLLPAPPRVWLSAP